MTRADPGSAEPGREAAPISVEAAADGTLTYLVAHAASELPPVRGRDILGAWSAAREAARNQVRETGRAFRFPRHDGGWTELRLRDRDATCWAGASDRMVGLRTGYGLSVCLRLLALIDLLARVPWAARLMTLEETGANLHPTLLRLAAETRLTDDAGFDEAGLHAHLADTARPYPCS